MPRREPKLVRPSGPKPSRLICCAVCATNAESKSSNPKLRVESTAAHAGIPGNGSDRDLTGRHPGQPLDPAENCRPRPRRAGVGAAAGLSRPCRPGRYSSGVHPSDSTSFQTSAQKIFPPRRCSLLVDRKCSPLHVRQPGPPSATLWRHSPVKKCESERW